MEIFDSRGIVRPTFTDAELASLSQERRQLFQRVCDVARAAESTEAELAASQKNLIEAVARRSEAVATVQRLNPRPSFHDLWRETFHPERLK